MEQREDPGGTQGARGAVRAGGIAGTGGAGWTAAVPVEVHGSVADGWEPVRTAFARNFERRGERGAAVAVYRHGRKTVDLWAGARDADAPLAGVAARPWTRETAQVIRSATKGVAAACLLLLHQRGLLDLDAPVAGYWPQFKAAGKERVTVREALAHRAGVPALDTPLTPGQALDGVSGPRAVAAQAPLFPPGAAHGYHAQTYGWLLAELVLRISGRTMGEFVADEIAGPLGLDLWLGLPAAELDRVGRTADIAVPEPSVSGALRARPKRSVHDAYADPASLTRRAFGAISPAPDENAPAYLAAGLAASGGVATARALARCYAAFIGDVGEVGEVGDAGDLDDAADTGDVGAGDFGRAQGVGDSDGRAEGGRGGGGRQGGGGQRLFTPATAAAARTAESEGPDRVLVVNTRFGPGYMLHGPSSPLLGPSSFGHPGRGGCLAFADPEHGVGFGYVTNGMQKNVTADPRAQALVRAVRECIR